MARLMALLLAAQALLACAALLAAYRHISALLHPPLALARPVYPPLWGNSTYLCTHRTASTTRLPYCLHLQSLPSPLPSPSCHLLLVPGTAAHSSSYHSAVPALSLLTGCHVHGVDLQGSGRTGGDRGHFTLDDWVADVRAAAEHIQAVEREQWLQRMKGGDAPSHLPIVLLGSSMGGEVVWQALRLLPQSLIPAAISLNLFLSPHLSPSALVTALRHPMLRWLRLLLADWLVVPLRLFIDLAAGYASHTVEGARVWEERLRDPLSQWGYGLASYLSVFDGLPAHAPSPHNSGKHHLIVCGERDSLVDWRHCHRAYQLLQQPYDRTAGSGEQSGRGRGGSVELYVWPSGEHQLLLLRSAEFARLIGSWIAAVSSDVQARWKGKRTAAWHWHPPAEFEASVHTRDSANTTDDGSLQRAGANVGVSREL